MLAGDIVSLFRILGSERSNIGHVPDSDALTLANQASVDVALRIDWPEASMTTSTVASTAEYQLIDLVAILRVYVAGQLLYYEDISTLQGEQLEQFDQSATDQSLRPLWVQQQAVGTTYPQQNDQANPVAGGLPYYLGQRPVFYLRGGNLGLMPAPLGVYTLQVDFIPLPAYLSTMSTPSDMPLASKAALAWKMVSYLYQTDGNDNGQTRAEAMFEKCVRETMRWRTQLVRSKITRPNLYPYRILFNPHRWSLAR